MATKNSKLRKANLLHIGKTDLHIYQLSSV